MYACEVDVLAMARCLMVAVVRWKAMDQQGRATVLQKMLSPESSIQIDLIMFSDSKVLVRCRSCWSDHSEM